MPLVASVRFVVALHLTQGGSITVDDLPLVVAITGTVPVNAAEILFVAVAEVAAGVAAAAEEEEVFSSQRTCPQDRLSHLK